MKFENLILSKTLEIRSNWKDIEKLKVLLDAWER